MKIFLEFCRVILNKAIGTGKINKKKERKEKKLPKFYRSVFH